MIPPPPFESLDKSKEYILSFDGKKLVGTKFTGGRPVLIWARESRMFVKISRKVNFGIKSKLGKKWKSGQTRIQINSFNPFCST